MKVPGRLSPKGSIIPTFKAPQIKKIILSSKEFLENFPPSPLESPTKCADVGIYAIYYKPPVNSPYAKLAIDWESTPIYVGKATFPGSRSGKPIAKFDGVTKRAKQHAKSISLTDLSLSDFKVRFIPVSGVEVNLIPAIESYLIRQYQPAWNTCVDGFGNHDPGSGRYQQAWSDWDSLHRGRPWTQKLLTKPKQKQAVIEKLEKSYGTSNP